LLLATDNAGSTVFHEAAKSFGEEEFQGILNWAKENMTKGELNKLLLATDNAGRTVFHVAEESSN
jgi:endo-1,4-beta-D-glucanase Y